MAQFNSKLSTKARMCPQVLVVVRRFHSVFTGAETDKNA